MTTKANTEANTEANKALARRYLELYNTGNLRIADELIAPDFVDQTRPDLPPGPEPVKRVVAELRSAFPDAQATIEQLIAEGDRVAFRFFLQGTHQGTFAGIAPTGKVVRLTGTDVVRIADGKLRELWSSQDTLNWALQLGLVRWVAETPHERTWDTITEKRLHASARRHS